MQGQKASPALLVRIATKNDLDRLTELHWASFQPEEHVPVMLGKDYVRATYRWLVTSSQAYCLVAESNHQIMGLVAVCDGSFTRAMFLACLPEFTRSLLRSPHLLFRKRLWGRLLRSAETSQRARSIVAYPGFAQLTVIAVDRAWRGAGIFRSLVEATKAFSKDRGSEAIRAGVYKSNQPSRRAFAKNGWIELPELETNETIFYVHFLNAAFAKRLGIEWPCSAADQTNESNHHCE